jgi:hypothetical protein
VRPKNDVDYWTVSQYSYILYVSPPLTDTDIYRLLNLNPSVSVQRLSPPAIHPTQHTTIFVSSFRSSVSRSIKMADAPPAASGGRGGFGRGDGRGRGRGDGRGRGRGRGGRGGRGGRDDENVWMPVTKLGRLVKEGKIGSLEEIFLFSLPVKEAEIIEFFLKDKLQDEVMKVC